MWNGVDNYKIAEHDSTWAKLSSAEPAESALMFAMATATSLLVPGGA